MDLRLSDIPVGRVLQVDGGSTWVRDRPGPPGRRPVVLLHGLAATGALNWAHAYSLLGRDHRVVTIDHRGHGRGIRTSRFGLEDCADDAAGVISHLGLRDPIVVGYSMGGPIATLLWRRHRDLVGSLVLCATSQTFRAGVVERILGGMALMGGLLPIPSPTWLVRQWSHLLAPLGAGPAQSAALVRWAMDEMAGTSPQAVMQAGFALAEHDSSRWLARVTVPTAVVATTRDRAVPPSRQIRLARSIPEARLFEVPVGHFCVAGPGGSAFYRALADACRYVDAPSASTPGTATESWSAAG